VASPAFRPDIEGLRGLAILLVVAFHVGAPGITGGFVGVDVFFVLSGYLITRLMIDEIERDGRLSFVGFYARRARRLLPAAALVLVATLLLGLAVYSPIELRDLARTAQSVAVYASNFRFALDSVHYLGPNVDVDPLLHTWSLGVEEQFYLLWPLIVAGLMALGRRRTLAIGMLVVTGASLAACAWLTPRFQPWAFYGSPMRFWELGLGALATILPATTAPRVLDSTAFALACLALVLGAAIGFSAHTEFPGLAATLPALGAAGLLRAGAAAAPNRIIRLFALRPMMWFGRRSYSWYLWHWPLVVLAGVAWPHRGIALEVAAGLLALACASLTLRFVEDPVRTSAKLRSRPLLSIGVGVAFVVFGLGLVQAVRVYADRVSARPEQQRFARARTDKPRLYEDDCILMYSATETEHACVYGEPNAPTTVVLFGDSHAIQWFPALETLALSHHWRLVVRAKAECPAADVPALFSEKLHRAYTECPSWRARALDEVVAMKPALVVVSSASPWLGDRDDAEHVAVATWQKGLASVVARLIAAHAQVAWIADTPRPGPGDDVPVCLSRSEAALLGTRDCTFDRDDRGFVRAGIAAVTAAGGRAIDLADHICTSSRCEVERDGVVIYTDTNHLTASFAASLAPVLANALGDLAK
jgi:peptidoglycan/LPS O-acetylase OafA/YrhL